MWKLRAAATTAACRQLHFVAARPDAAGEMEWGTAGDINSSTDGASKNSNNQKLRKPSYMKVVGEQEQQLDLMLREGWRIFSSKIKFIQHLNDMQNQAQAQS